VHRPWRASCLSSRWQSSIVGGTWSVSAEQGGGDVVSVCPFVGYVGEFGSRLWRAWLVHRVFKERQNT
jgi:hypothetical protein